MTTRAAGCAVLLEAYRETLDRRFRLGAVAATTRLSLLRVARRFLGHYPNVDLAMITPEHIERYLVSLPQSARSLHTELMRLRSFFRWVVNDHRVLRVNPCDRVTKPKWSSDPRPAVTEQQFLSLCRVASSLEDILLLEILYHTGLRIREFLSLRERDFDCSNRRILVTGKGARRQHVFFPPHVADLITAALSGRADRPLLASRGGTTRRQDWVGEQLRRLGQSSGLPYPLTSHLLRHGLAWLLKTSDMPLAVIQQVMRHRNIQTTISLYGRLMPDDIQAIYDQHLKGRA